MPTLRRFALLTGFLAFGAGPVVAQDCGVNLHPPAAGSWVQYTMSEGSMRLALLGEETKGGKKMMRLEMSVASREGAMIIQMLVPGYPYDAGAVEDVIIKPANAPAMRMNAQMMGMMRSRIPRDAVADACRNRTMTRVGEESVTVPAGTFRTVHYRDAESGNDVWVSESVPFGMVKSQLKNGGEIVLTGRGNDAKSQITETPMEM